MGQTRPLVHLFSFFQTHITIFTTHKCGKMFIQHMVPGFELTRALDQGSLPRNKFFMLLRLLQFRIKGRFKYVFSPSIAHLRATNCHRDDRLNTWFPSQDSNSSVHKSTAAKMTFIKVDSLCSLKSIYTTNIKAFKQLNPIKWVRSWIIKK